MTIYKKNYCLRIAIIFIVFISMLLSSCAKETQTTAQVTSTSTVQPVLIVTNTQEGLPIATPTETPTPIDTLQAPEVNQISCYTFEAELDYNKHTLDVTESIHYFNNTGQELSELSIVVSPNFEAGVFDLQALSINGDNPHSGYLLDGITLSINLETPLAINESITVDIQFTLNIPLKNGILGYTVKQTNLSDWYPFVPPFDPNLGWIIHQPSEVGEFLVYEVADFDLTLTLKGPQTLVIASSVESVPIEPFVYRLTAKNSRNLTFSVSDQYIKLSDQFGSTTVRAYVFAGDKNSGNAAMNATGNAILLFSDLFGVSYPHETMTIVEADFADGMEYDGLYYLSEGYFDKYEDNFQNYLSLLSVHETAHQWWFALVGNDQALEPWLDESLATYSEYLFVENYYPELMDWWWEYRVDEYQPSGDVDMTIYDQSDLRTYINAVYLQGATFLHEMRQALGDEIFFAGLRTYARTYQSRIAHWSSFVGVMVPDRTDSASTILQNYFAQ